MELQLAFPAFNLCRTDVVEFVSTEHTPRNLLVRAVKQSAHSMPSSAEVARLRSEYNELKEYWGVTPHLEMLLQPGLHSGYFKGKQALTADTLLSSSIST